MKRISFVRSLLPTYAYFPNDLLNSAILQIIFIQNCIEDESKLYNGIGSNKILNLA